MYPPIDPILLRLGPITIHWYGLIMVTAIFLATYVTSRYVARHGEDPNNVWDLLLWVLIPAFIGARLYFVFIQSSRGPNGLEHYLANPGDILAIWKGGIHIYGALIFGGLALFIYLRVKKLPLWIYLDGAGLGLLLGQAIGRLGNFVNQELYGPPTTLPWGLRIDASHRLAPYDDLNRYPDSTRFHPLFLYELSWDSLGFVILFWLSRRFEKQLRAGDLFLMYLIWAPLGRFFIEFLRTDSWFFPGTPFNVLHILTGLMVVGATVALVVRLRRRSGITSQPQVDETDNPAVPQIDEADSSVAPTSSTIATPEIEG
ncbi:prolipoprotein diacylglyceryl transferase [Dictyobacter alpinus]|uniref:Phosphatidylglycerol--prolipoprotein diacylglyceryl transferase n=1 Tax=Dictyobacter alpinus TaxID=2014873 RepID=A0A402B3N5_9CHLR|nr:prolipoprotein diacylglyceryl transferase [Dictyobacter alpinus]GCE25956.1 prolipoprotein diacylglyceryl transferase [Dictyobacter alpinus]